MLVHDPPAPAEQEELRIPPWDPSSHAFSAHIQEYAPGKNLSYIQHPGWAEPLLLLAFALVLGVLAGSAFFRPILGGFLALLLVGAYFLVQWKHGVYLATKWDFDFDKNTLLLTRGEDFTNYSLLDVDAVLLRHVRKAVRHSKQQSFSNYNAYNAHIALRGLKGAEPLEIAQTGERREDPANTYYDGLAFANMLAAQLHVPIEVEQLEEAP